MTLNSTKLFDLASACKIRENLRNQNKKVVLTNGCFDLLHAGHIYSIHQAAAYGDSLWIALNSDTSVKKLKGDKRPIFNEDIRAYILSALEDVNGIFLFKNSTLTNEILSFKPDVYVKSGDYTLESLNKSERSALQTIQAKIYFVPFLNGFSTTSIIKQITNNQSCL